MKFDENDRVEDIALELGYSRSRTASASMMTDAVMENKEEVEELVVFQNGSMSDPHVGEMQPSYLESQNFQ